MGPEWAKRQPLAGLALHGLLLAWTTPSVPLAPPEMPVPAVPLPDDELAALLGLTPDQAARVPQSFWDAARELLAS